MLLRRRDNKSIGELKERLRSLDENCLTSLNRGIGAMLDRDLTVRVVPQTAPIEHSSSDPQIRELIEIFNSMLTTAQDSLQAYEDLRERLRTNLGDQSCLFDLHDKLTSLRDVCLTGLGNGLDAASKGDLTVERQFGSADAQAKVPITAATSRTVSRIDTRVPEPMSKTPLAPSAAERNASTTSST